MDAGGRIAGLQESVFSPMIKQPQSVGVNFAVAEPYVRKVFEDIRDYGKVIRGQPGFTYENATKPDRTKLPMRQPGAGALILTVEAGSAADRIGLKKDDIIIACGDTKIAEKNDLDARLALTHPGNSLKLVYTRGGERHEVELLLGGDALPSHPPPPQPKPLAAMPH
jgi:S1-C subfamily serine protease